MKRIERDGEIVTVPVYEDDETEYDTRKEQELDKEIKKKAR
jgi:hypothetical protein